MEKSNDSHKLRRLLRKAEVKIYSRALLREGVDVKDSKLFNEKVQWLNVFGVRDCEPRCSKITPGKIMGEEFLGGGPTDYTFFCLKGESPYIYMSYDLALNHKNCNLEWGARHQCPLFLG